MTVKEQREILEAYERGEEIEWKPIDYESFNFSLSKEYGGEDYAFDFVHYAYRIKKKRWRATFGEKYYYLPATLKVTLSIEENYTADDERYNAGNYFQTKEEASEASELIKETLTNYHESL